MSASPRISPRANHPRHGEVTPHEGGTHAIHSLVLQTDISAITEGLSTLTDLAALKTTLINCASDQGCWLNVIAATMALRTKTMRLKIFGKLLSAAAQTPSSDQVVLDRLKTISIEFLIRISTRRSALEFSKPLMALACAMHKARPDDVKQWRALFAACCNAASIAHDLLFEQVVKAWAADKALLPGIEHLDVLIEELPQVQPENLSAACTSMASVLAEVRQPEMTVDAWIALIRQCSRARQPFKIIKSLCQPMIDADVDLSCWTELLNIVKTKRAFEAISKKFTQRPQALLERIHQGPRGDNASLCIALWKTLRKTGCLNTDTFGKLLECAPALIAILSPTVLHNLKRLDSILESARSNRGTLTRLKAYEFHKVRMLDMHVPDLDAVLEEIGSIRIDSDANEYKELENKLITILEKNRRDWVQLYEANEPAIVGVSDLHANFKNTTALFRAGLTTCPTKLSGDEEVFCRALIRSIAETGRLDLTGAEPKPGRIDRPRDDFNDLNWSALDALYQKDQPFHSFRENQRLAHCVDQWLQSFKRLISHSMSQLEGFESSGTSRPSAQFLLHFLPALKLLNPHAAKLTSVKKMLTEDKHFDVDGILSKRTLFEGRKGIPENRLEILRTLERWLIESPIASGSEGEEIVNTYLKSWSELKDLNNDKQLFVSEYSNNRRLSVKMLPKNSLRTLNIGNEVNCCMATDHDNFRFLLQRLRNSEWIPYHTVQGDTTYAVAWTALLKNKNGDSVMCIDFSDFKSSIAPSEVTTEKQIEAAKRGALIADELWNSGVKLGKILGVAEVWLGAQQYGRAENILPYSKVASNEFIQQDFSKFTEPRDDGHFEFTNRIHKLEQGLLGHMGFSVEDDDPSDGRYIYTDNIGLQDGIFFRLYP